jgi:hypothetical protein
MHSALFLLSLTTFALLTSSFYLSNSISTLGASLKQLSQLGVPAALKIAWRSQIMIVLMLLPTIIELKLLKPEERERLFRRSTLWHLVQSAWWWCCGLVLWVESIQRTTIARAAM